MSNKSNTSDQIEVEAANGLLHRRLFLKAGSALVASGTTFLSAKAAPPKIDSWSTTPGIPPQAYGIGLRLSLMLFGRSEVVPPL